MALDKFELESDIKGLLTDMMNKDTPSVDEFARRLSVAIYLFVKQGEVDYQGGLANSGGPVTGTLIGNIK